MSLLYTDEDLARWFDEGTLGRSERCIGGVSQLERHGDVLIAEVQGTAARPYRVKIDLAASMRTPRSRLQGDCSCPVGQNCKHMAATLMVYLLDGAIEYDERVPVGAGTDGGLVQPVRPQLLAELSRWQAMRSQPAKPVRNGVVFELSTVNHRPSVLMRKVKYRADGGIEFGKWTEITAEMLLTPPNYLTPADMSIIAQLWAERRATTPEPRIDISATLALIVASGHGWVFCGRDRVPARAGATRWMASCCRFLPCTWTAMPRAWYWAMPPATSTPSPARWGRCCSM